MRVELKRIFTTAMKDIFLLISICNAVLVVLADAAKSPLPHIIVIVADDLGWDDVGFHGSPQIPTPNLDLLANSGVILNNYYVSPSSFATKAEMLTGKYASHMGLQHGVLHNQQPLGIPLSEKLLPQFLKEMGYNTHAVGKWALGFQSKEYTPTYRGFDTFYGMWTSSSADYYTHAAFDGYYGLDLRRNMEVVRNETGHYSTELFTAEAIKLIAKHDASKPLFLYFAHQAVHTGNIDDPFQVPQRYVDRVKHIRNEKRRKFAAMVIALDESVKNLTSALTQNKMMSETIILFTTDNGGAAGGLELGAASNYPLRGGKLTVWEGGIRAVGFVYSEMLAMHSGRVTEELMHATDWFPTLFYLSGGNLGSLKPLRLDGYNIWGSIASEKMSPRFEILHNLDPLQGNQVALRVGDYKLIINQDVGYYGDWYPRPVEVGELTNLSLPVTLPNAIVKCDKNYPHPFLEMHAPPCNPMKKPCLFNIQWDPCEYHNLAEFMPHTMHVLLERLWKYRQGIVYPKYPGYDNPSNPELHGGVWSTWKNDTSSPPPVPKPAGPEPVLVGPSKPRPPNERPATLVDTRPDLVTPGNTQSAPTNVVLMTGQESGGKVVTPSGVHAQSVTTQPNNSSEHGPEDSTLLAEHELPKLRPVVFNPTPEEASAAGQITNVPNPSVVQPPIPPKQEAPLVPSVQEPLPQPISQAQPPLPPQPQTQTQPQYVNQQSSQTPPGTQEQAPLLLQPPQSVPQPSLPVATQQEQHPVATQQEQHPVQPLGSPAEPSNLKGLQQLIPPETIGGKPIGKPGTDQGEVKEVFDVVSDSGEHITMAVKSHNGSKEIEKEVFHMNDAMASGESKTRLNTSGQTFMAHIVSNESVPNPVQTVALADSSQKSKEANKSVSVSNDEEFTVINTKETSKSSQDTFVYSSGHGGNTNTLSKPAPISNPQVSAAVNNEANAGGPGSQGTSTDVSMATNVGAAAPSAKVGATLPNPVSPLALTKPKEPTYQMAPKAPATPAAGSKSKSGSGSKSGSTTESETSVGGKTDTGVSIGGFKGLVSHETANAKLASYGPSTPEGIMHTLTTSKTKSNGEKINSFSSSASASENLEFSFAIPQHNDLPNVEIVGSRPFQSVSDVISDNKETVGMVSECPDGRHCINKEQGPAQTSAVPAGTLPMPHPENQAPVVPANLLPSNVTGSDAKNQATDCKLRGDCASSGIEATSKETDFKQPHELNQGGPINATAIQVVPDVDNQALKKLPGRDRKTHIFFGKILVDRTKEYYVKGKASQDESLLQSDIPLVTTKVDSDVRKHNIGFNVMLPARIVKKFGGPKFKEHVHLFSNKGHKLRLPDIAGAKAHGSIKKVFDLVGDERKTVIPMAEPHLVTSKNTIATLTDKVKGESGDIGATKPIQGTLVDAKMSDAEDLTPTSSVNKDNKDDAKQVGSAVQDKNSKSSSTSSAVSSKQSSSSNGASSNSFPGSEGDLGSIVTLVGKVQVDHLNGRKKDNKLMHHKPSNSTSAELAHKKTSVKERMAMKHMKHNGSETNAANVGSFNGPSNSIIVSSVIVVIIASFVVVGMAVVAIVAVVARHCRVGKKMDAS